MQQDELFPVWRPWWTTSQAAYASVKPHLGRLQTRILEEIERRPSTDDEIEQRLDLLHQTASATRRCLVKAGRIIDSGDRRKTRSGRKAIVWKVKP